MINKKSIYDTVYSRQQMMPQEGDVASMPIRIRLLHYIMQGAMFIALLASVVTETEDHPIFLSLYMLVCLITLITAVSGKLPQILNLLALIVGYQSLTFIWLPILRREAFFTAFIALVCLILGIRFVRRNSIVSTVLILVACTCGYRYVLGGTLAEFSEGAQFFSAAVIGLAICSSPLTKNELLWILETIIFTTAAVIVLIVLDSARQSGWFLYFIDIVLGVQRLGVGGYQNSANSIAYLAAVGVACGSVLLAHRKRVLPACAIVVMCICFIIATKSRGSMLSLIVYIWAMFLGYRPKMWLFTVIGSLIIVMLVLPFVWDTEAVRTFLRLDEARFNIKEARGDIWAENIKIVKEFPLTGITQREYKQINALQVDLVNKDGYVQSYAMTPHNLIISYLVHYGLIVGLGLVMSSLYALWMLYRRCLTANERVIALIPIFGFLIHLSVDMWNFIYLFLFALIAIPGSVSRLYTKNGSHPVARVRIR